MTYRVIYRKQGIERLFGVLSDTNDVPTIKRLNEDIYEVVRIENEQQINKRKR